MEKINMEKRIHEIEQNSEEKEKRINVLLFFLKKKAYY